MKKTIITGITIEEQMRRAKLILLNDILPREELYRARLKKRKK